MRAVVLVGGEGTRLRPLTETIPKPLIPFMNRPFLHHVLDHLAAHGVSEALLSSPYLEEEFGSFLKQRRGDPSITWLSEEQPLGTAGAIARAADLLDRTFLALNGDVLTDLDLTALVAFHRRSGAVATIALTRVPDARPYGLVESDEAGRVLAFREKPADPIPGDVNAGTYVLEPRALDDVPRTRAVSIERETFPGLIVRDQPVRAFVGEAYWRDLGTPEAYLDAHVDALEGRIGSGFARPLVGEGARMDQGAIVGDLVVIGPGARVARGARVERAVLHEGASVGEGAEVERSVLGPSVEVGPGAVVRGSLLAEGAVVRPGSRVLDARVGPGAVAVEG